MKTIPSENSLIKQTIVSVKQSELSSATTCKRKQTTNTRSQSIQTAQENRPYRSIKPSNGSSREHVSTSKRPNSSGKQLASTSKRPISSGKQLLIASKRLGSSVMQLRSASKRPNSSGKRLVSTGKRPGSSVMQLGRAEINPENIIIHPSALGKQLLLNNQTVKSLKWPDRNTDNLPELLGHTLKK